MISLLLIQFLLDLFFNTLLAFFIVLLNLVVVLALFDCLDPILNLPQLAVNAL